MLSCMNAVFLHALKAYLSTLSSPVGCLFLLVLLFNPSPVLSQNAFKILPQMAELAVPSECRHSFFEGGFIVCSHCFFPVHMHLVVGICLLTKGKAASETKNVTLERLLNLLKTTFYVSLKHCIAYCHSKCSIEIIFSSGVCFEKK